MTRSLRVTAAVGEFEQRTETIEDLRARKIGFRSLTENMDTTTAAGELMFHIFGASEHWRSSSGR